MTLSKSFFEEILKVGMESYFELSYIAVDILGPFPWGFLTHAPRLEGFPCILFSNLEVDAIIFKSLDRHSTSVGNNFILGALAMFPVLTSITKQVLSLC